MEIMSNYTHAFSKRINDLVLSKPGIKNYGQYRSDLYRWN